MIASATTVANIVKQMGELTIGPLHLLGSSFKPDEFGVQRNHMQVSKLEGFLELVDPSGEPGKVSRSCVNGVWNGYFCHIVVCEELKGKHERIPINHD